MKTRRGQGKKVQEEDKPLDIGEIKTDFAAELRKTLQSFRQRAKNASTVESLGSIVSEIEVILKEKKPSETHKFKISARQALAQLKELETAAFQNIAEMRSEIEDGLARAYAREAYQWFSAEALKLKEEVATRRDTLHAVEVHEKAKAADEQIRARLALLKNCDVRVLAGKALKSVDATIMANTVKESLFHPVWLSRRLEKEFGVIVDKPKSTHIRTNGCSITGVVEDVNACVTRLETLDLSGKKALLLDARSYGQVMGQGEARALEIEKKTGAIIYGSQSGSEVTILGSEAAVAKAMGMIGDVKEVTGDGLISDQVRLNFFVAKSLLSDSIGKGTEIEKANNVAFSLTPADADAIITVRGSPEGVARAVAAIHRYEQGVACELFPVTDREACAMLFESSGGRKGLSEIRQLAKFSALRRETGVFVLREATNKVIGLVAPDGDVTKLERVVSEINDAFIKIRWMTDRVDVAKEHNRCWTEAICNLIGSRSGAELSFRRSENIANPNQLEIWGTDEAKRKAHALVEEVYHAESVNVPDEAAKPLLEGKALVIHEIQDSAIVHLGYAKFEKKLFVYGLSDCKKKAVEQFKQFVADVIEAQSHLTIKEIELRREEIGILIGPKGKTVRRIQDQSGCDDVRVDGDALKVVLTGSATAVDSAIIIIEEELNSKKVPVVVQGSPSEMQEPVRVRLLDMPKEGWVVVEPENIVLEKPQLDNVDLFPALGAGGKKKGRK